MVIEGLPGALDDASDLLTTRLQTVPDFLRQRTLATDVAPASGGALADEGSTGLGVSPGDWFDGVVLTHLTQAWQKHASVMDSGVVALTKV